MFDGKSQNHRHRPNSRVLVNSPEEIEMVPEYNQSTLPILALFTRRFCPPTEFRPVNSHIRPLFTNPSESEIK
jgi:hypothetical protein